ncbi:glycosyl hydrolase [Tateyamaria omphalii]|uniref:Uncharacterized protein n=1 Tax=Tateyamaria omphalii TaxID=299262 RepID=A0A1P8MW90_9RHOB|nr:glycosyl hydrolase [Tateyamaria omphalii]APX12334.1 hypothetical protein BWR18_12085 [Tateyamaria omphalii]
MDLPDTKAFYAGGTLDFLKLIGSAAALHGRRVVGGEFLTWMSRDYMTSPHKIKVHADRFFVSGITQLHYHSMYYQAPEAAYPGFNAWSQPDLPVSFAGSMTRANPIFDYLRDLNANVARNQLIAQSGRNMANIGVFHNIWRYPGRALRQEETVSGYLGAGDMPPLLGFPPPFEALSPEEQHISQRVQTSDALKSAGYDYVLVNSDSLMRGELRDGVLHMGDIRMEALVLSNETHLPADLARRLIVLSNDGFKVFFVGETPARHSGFHVSRMNDAVVSNMTEALATREWRADSPQTLPALLEAADVAPGLRFQSDQPEMQYIRRQIGDDRFYFIRSSDEEPRNFTGALPCDATCAPWHVDLWTGVQTHPPLHHCDDGMVVLSGTLEPFGSMMIRLGPGTEKRHVANGDLPVTRIGPTLSSKRRRRAPMNSYLGMAIPQRLLPIHCPPSLALKTGRCASRHDHPTGRQRRLNSPLRHWPTGAISLNCAMRRGGRSTQPALR